MNVLVTTEHRFSGTPDGCIWTNGQFPYSYFMRYLDVFDEVIVAARVRDVHSREPQWKPAGGAGVTFAPVPHYIGPLQFARQLHRIRDAMRRTVQRADAAIFRGPSMIANMAESAIGDQGRPYALEVVGDPAVVFTRGVVDHPLRPLFRWYAVRQLKRQCRRACATAYLTRGALQMRYPPGAGVFNTSYPEVELRDDAYASPMPHRDYRSRPLVLIGVGSMAQRYKGFDVLLNAARSCLRMNVDLELVLVGDGQYRPELEALAEDLGVRNRVTFAGQLPSGPAVRERLDRAHLFVMPSRTEGMPSAMIEAMARGLPCIGSRVGGIPELLPEQDLVMPGDVQDLAAKIREVAASPDRMTLMAARNLEQAYTFHESKLRALRVEFYRYVRQRTEAWRKTIETR